jgi:para-aminobenzoate synthetase component 1
MSWPRYHPLPYQPDAAVWFAALKALDCPVWLDSAGGGAGGRYDILSAEPYRCLRFAWEEADAVASALREVIAQPTAGDPALPFAGGAIGYLGYELGRAWQGLPRYHAHDLPVAAFGLYDWALVLDHRRQRAVLVGQGRDPALRRRWDALCRTLEQAASVVPGEVAASAERAAGVADSLPWPAYEAAFARVAHYLREGDCYQVNLTHRFEAELAVPAWHLYRRLRTLSPAPYGAFLDLGDFQLLSNSPEQFLSLREGEVITRPIKGTRPRHADPELDARLRAELLASDKDRAENLMIVDLLRNDLGRVCVPGSIEVPELFRVESFARVHHLVSPVRGRLAAGYDAVDLLRAGFPGGSITGAPKRRAMEIIDELEPVSREAYCGSLFHLGFDGRLESSIAIRTLVRQGARLRYWAGGGVVFDSRAAEEFQESLDKAAAFFELVGARPEGDQSPSRMRS